MSYWNKIKKLRRMSRSELHSRFSSQLVRRRERGRWRRGAQESVRPGSVAAADLLQRSARLIPGTTGEQIKALATVDQTLLEYLRRRAKARAELLLQDHWVILGYPVDLRAEIDWHADFRTGYRWKRSFYADLPLYNLAGETDVKYPWELSRHQFLCDLARDFQLNGSERSAQRAGELLLDWIDQNPLYEGVNWTSGLEVAMRAISWAWTLAGLATWDGWKPDTLKKIATSLWDHGVYLADNFSYYSSPYNHLMGEASGLLLIASLFDEDSTTRAWDQQARETLRGAAPKQFYQDHFCVEQAVGYHYYTLGFLVHAWCTAQHSGRPLEELSSVIRQGFLTGATFRRPDGTWPAVGDLDSARALPVFPENDWSFDSLHHLAAAALDDDRLRLPGDLPGEELYWLLGAEGVQRWHQMAPGEDNGGGTHVHRDSGYAVANDGRDWMLFDAGPIAGGLFADATPSTAHGHADMLQVLYVAGGETVLEDSGMPFYGGDPVWVNYFRSPAAHNTVQIDQAEFVRHAGRLAWSHEVRRPTLAADLKSELWLCGGQVSWPGVSHERQVCCLPGIGLWVADLIVTDRPRSVVWYWQLPAAAKLTDAHLVSWRDHTLWSHSSGGSGEVVLTEATDAGPEGWRCHGYGQKSPGTRLSVRHEVTDRLLVLTSIGSSQRPVLGVELGNLKLRVEGASPESDRQLVQLGQCRWYLPQALLMPAVLK